MKTYLLINRPLLTALLTLLLALHIGTIHADNIQEAKLADQPFVKFGEEKVYYQVFNTSFLQPSIAERYNITRGKNRALVNIMVMTGDRVGGVEAKISGTAQNLLQQQQRLEFMPVREESTVYYLASVTFTNEEIIHFSIQIQRPNQSHPYQLTFTKKLYVDL